MCFDELGQGGPRRVRHLGEEDADLVGGWIDAAQLVASDDDPLHVRLFRARLRRLPCTRKFCLKAAEASSSANSRLLPAFLS